MLESIAAIRTHSNTYKNIYFLRHLSLVGTFRHPHLDKFSFFAGGNVCFYWGVHRALVCSSFCVQKNRIDLSIIEKAHGCLPQPYILLAHLQFSSNWLMFDLNQNQVLIILAILSRMVKRMVGSISAVQRLGTTAPRKHRCGGYTAGELNSHLPRK